MASTTFSSGTVLTSTWLNTTSSKVYGVTAGSAGATADGTTDDTAAIQAIITAAGANATIYFPPGTYKIKGSLTISNDNVTLLGYGAKILAGANLSAGADSILVTGNNFQMLGFWFSMDTRITMVRVQTSSAALSGFTFSDLKADNHFYGIRLDGALGFMISNFVIDNCILNGFNGQANAPISGDYCKFGTVSNSVTRYANNAASIGFRESDHITITNCTARDNANLASSDADIEIENCPNGYVTISNCVVDHDIWVDDSSGVSITGCVARRIKMTVNADNNRYVTITGNTIGRLTMDSIGTPGAYRNSANVVGNTFHPALYSDAYGLFCSGTYVGKLNFRNNVFVSNGSSANVQITRDAGASFYLHGNDFNGGTVTFASSGGTVSVRNNVDYITEASGTGTINSGSTSATITHGLSVTPTLQDIVITLGEDPTTTPGAIWVDTLGATTFKVNCEVNPGASNLDFAWKALITRAI